MSVTLTDTFLPSTSATTNPSTRQGKRSTDPDVLVLVPLDLSLVEVEGDGHVRREEGEDDEARQHHVEAGELPEVLLVIDVEKKHKAHDDDCYVACELRDELFGGMLG